MFWPMTRATLSSSLSRGNRDKNHHISQVGQNLHAMHAKFYGPSGRVRVSRRPSFPDLRTVGIPLKAISPAGSDKQSNARAVSPMFQAGMILLPSNARWADQYIGSMTRFPKGTHDDVDPNVASPELSAEET